MNLGFFKWIFLISALTYGLAVWKVSQFPHSFEIKSDLSNDPVQKFYSKKEVFPLEYRGKKYWIKPIASYSISGMIVSHNDIQALDDIYHDSNSVDVRDLCLIWGQNVEKDNYLSFNFKNEPFSCHISQKRSYSPGNFTGTNLSNNHLLVASEKIRKQIYSLHEGDQIRLRGKLIDYGVPDGPVLRNTSTVRTDEGNGACEVVFVEEVQVLARWKPEWWQVRSLAATSILISGILSVLCWIIGPIWEYEKRKREIISMEENYNKKMGRSF